MWLTLLWEIGQGRIGICVTALPGVRILTHRLLERFMAVTRRACIAEERRVLAPCKGDQELEMSKTYTSDERMAQDLRIQEI